MKSIARNFNVGVELHENALNKISAVLYQERPELFEAFEDILIDPDSQRKLSLYAFLDEPFGFNFHPIQNSPINQGGLYTQAALTFTLTDKLQGDDTGNLITRIKMKLQAGMEIQQDSSVKEQKINIFLKDIRFTDFASDHPLSTNTLIRNTDNLPTTDSSFVAILNYLIDVFLQKALKKPLTNFPFPPIHLISDPKIYLYLRGLNIWGNTLGIYLSLQNDGSTTISGPIPNNNNDISIGMTQETVTKAFNALLPIKTPIPPTQNNRTFYIGANSWIELLGSSRSSIDLEAPNKIKATLSFNAKINGHIYIKLWKYKIRTNLPIPIGNPSRIEGAFNAFIEETENAFLVKMRPSVDFFKDEFTTIILASDYRNLFKTAVRKWLKKNVLPVFRKIPIIGWFISKSVEVIVAELMAYFAGTLLDGILTTFFSILLTALYNALGLALPNKMAFELTSVEKKLPGEDIPLKIQSLSGLKVHPNAGGELLLFANFEQGTATAPEPPYPEAPDDYFVEEKDTTRPNQSLNPNDFRPTFSLSAPKWTNGTYDIYQSDIYIGDLLFKSEINISYSTDKTTDISTAFIEITMPDETGHKSLSQIDIQISTGRIISESENSWADTPDGYKELSSLVTYDFSNNIATQTRQFDNNEPEVEIIQIPGNTNLIGSVHGIFQLQSQLLRNTNGKVARIDVNDENDIVQSIPVGITTSEKYQLDINGIMTDVIDVHLVDRDFDTKAVFLANEPYTLLSLAQIGDDIEIHLRHITS